MKTVSPSRTNDRLPVTLEQKSIELDLLLAMAAPLAMTRGYTAPETEAAYARASAVCKEIMESSRAPVAMAGVATLCFVAGYNEKAEQIGRELFALARRQKDVGVELEANIILGQSVRKCLESHRDAIAGVDQLSSQELDQSMLILDEARSFLDQLSLSLRAMPRR